MYTLEKDFRFEAMHVLEHHDGKCARPHGHSYGCTVRLRARELQAAGPKINMLMDFSDVSAVVRSMIEKFLDHRNLNETLGTDSPTAEFIARWIFDYLKPHLPLLSDVTVSETTTSRATYQPEPDHSHTGNGVSLVHHNSQRNRATQQPSSQHCGCTATDRS
mmetsp:Transcript_12202/g.32854  ORF Transcript_12202/g.32854 Transcript_12202/m.32854 type:complete len:162 (+) Transcript_12202:85-570(+)